MTRRVDEARAALARWREQTYTAPAALFGADSTAVENDWHRPRSASKRWTGDALEAVRRAALARDFLTVSDVEWPDERDQAVDARARGAVLLAACKAGLLRATDSYAPGGPERHGRPVKVFKSLVRAA